MRTHDETESDNWSVAHELEHLRVRERRSQRRQERRQERREKEGRRA